MVKLIERANFEGERAKLYDQHDFSVQRKAPYGMIRSTLISSSGNLMNQAPWGTLAAMDLSKGTLKWEIPLGEVDGKAVGLPNAGGPMVTKGNLIFIAATFDKKFRAFDIETGKEVWEVDLPVCGMATPMTYEVDGKQYITLAVGGHGKMGVETGDYVMTFALP